MKGYNIIGKEISANNPTTISATNPATMETLDGEFHVATLEEAATAIEKAKNVAADYANLPGSTRALFLRTIADKIESLGSALVDRVIEESGLPVGRVTGERGRTCGQLRFFADKIEEGSWVNAIIDHPNGDIRQCAVALGPVVVFTASNFPLAFSTAGGDTASALAAGCPVIVKAHESHLGTNNMVAEAIQAACIECGIPDGVFSSLNGAGYELGSFLVSHEDVKAVAFTGSYIGGKALYDLAQKRSTPIPVFSEMGSINPVFLLPDAIKSEAKKWSEAIAGSVNLGAGQFCTNPGLLIVQEDDHLAPFKEALVESFDKLVAANMLNKGIYDSYEKNRHEKTKEAGVQVAYSREDKIGRSLHAQPCLLEVNAAEFLDNPKLSSEVFGPFSILVICRDKDEMLRVSNALEGQLTASIIGQAKEILDYESLIASASAKVGRIIINGMPTGVAVCEAMNHGGPFPATTDPRYTSVGGNAIYRFARPLCFQGFPDELLPDALKESNPLKIWRKVDGKFSKD